MIIIFVILILLVSVILGFIVLIQNPKGGGLASNVGGLSNQFMGVKQTTDVLEKGTWVFAAILSVLCICSVLFVSRSEKGGNNVIEKVNARPAPAGQPMQMPAPNAPGN
jgi:preprotein translocase subunit SecG